MEKNKNGLSSFDDGLAKGLDAILTVLTMILVAVVFIQVMTRYVLSFSFMWSEEVSIMSFEWIVFLGTGLGVRNGVHFIVDVFPESIPKKFEKFLDIFSNLLVMAASVFMIVYGISYAISGLSRYSYATGIPMFFIYISGPIAGVLAIIFAIENIIKLKSKVD